MEYSTLGTTKKCSETTKLLFSLVIVIVNLIKV